ncbi:hypothetical protein [Celerinatantimonas diazotrophica]|uniref:Tfp pilus assembly PilM family ATPase n=1 Tax=Celerinatantimonas diazotrophica TaxID=412034 RepID=A0A4R1K132_9GAMM|nr:hypothetical protein [Celerinatantimonas diazotrophica]TCK57696.1 hypothetical protein EV690_1390 [Celerinatantimonas diazotrophica]CAG9298242.1 hypothetical protein CEDIAZO_03437 [Celerinatantimonas diazotrophica]
MSRYAVLGVNLQEDAIQAALYNPDRPTRFFHCDFLTSGNWPENLWQHSERLLKAMAQIKSQLNTKRVRVMFNVPLACIQMGIISLPLNEHQYSDYQIAQACQRNGMDLSASWQIQIRWLANDHRHPGHQLFQAVGVPKRLIGVIDGVCRTLHWQLSCIDLACFARAYCWWQQRRPCAGRFAELHLVAQNNTLEVCLFLARRLLDWCQISPVNHQSLVNYLAQLGLLWRCLPGVRLKQARMFGDEHLSNLECPLEQFEFKLDGIHDASQMAALGGALKVYEWL